MANQSYYKICTSLLAADVEKEVNDLMAAGWTPLGNLLIAQQHDEEGEPHTIFVQAMVKDSSQRSRLPPRVR
jgi:hypothetical protein